MIQTEKIGRVLVARMDHGKVNAIDSSLMDALIDLLQEAETSSACSVVLTGTGKAFSAGVDLFQVLEGGTEYLKEFLPKLSSGLEKLFLFPKPVIAAVNGHAVAGGCVLTCASDYRIMAEGTYTIGLTELQVGVPFPAVPMEIIRYAADPRFLNEIVYTARTYSADEGLARGLVDELSPPELLLQRSCEIAEKLGAIPPHAFRITKHHLRLPYMYQAKQRAPEDAAILNAWTAPQTHEVIRGYLEKTIGKRR